MGWPAHRPHSGVSELLRCRLSQRQESGGGSLPGRRGGKHVLSLLVTAMPLKGVLLSYTDTNSAREVKGTVERRGLCGDVFLTSTPPAARITDVKIDTSVRKGEVTV